MAVCYSGDLDATPTTALAPIRALGDPVFDLLQEQPYTEVQSYLDETEPKGDHYYWKTEFVAELTDDAARDHAGAVRGVPDPARARSRFLHLGGALERARRGRRRGRQPRRALRVRRDRHVGSGRARAREELPAMDPRRPGSASGRSRPAATTSTSRPPTRTTSASGRPTAPTSTACSRSSGRTTRTTCSASNRNIAPQTAGH